VTAELELVLLVVDEIEAEIVALCKFKVGT